MILVGNVLANGFEIKNFKVDMLASAPTGVEARLYYNTTTHTLEFYNGTAWTSGAGITALTGDVTASGTGSVAATVAFIGGKAASAVGDAVDKKHAQHTDTGTTNATFQIDSSNSGPKLKNSSGEFQTRNAADNAYSDLRVKDLNVTGDTVITGNLTVNGTTTTLNTDTMETGDNKIVLNSEITAASGNTDGGVAVKRFHSDNSTRRDAELLFDNATTARWQAVFGVSTSAVVTKSIALVHAETIGDGSTTQFTVTHNLNSEDVVVSVNYASGTKEAVQADWRVTGSNTIRVDFGSAPTTNEFRIKVVG